jgi:hypothetical protein
MHDDSDRTSGRRIARRSLPAGETTCSTATATVIATTAPAKTKPQFIPPLTAIGPLFRYRFERIHRCHVDYVLDINPRATSNVYGSYYKTRRLVRVYVRDKKNGLRPLEELYDTYLHEMAHHLEYTEPFSFAANACGRVPGRMHSRLFWKILGELKCRWAELQDEDRSRAALLRAVESRDFIDW